MNTMDIFTNISRITNIHDHGRVVDNKRSKVQCNYCDKVVSGISRLKCHLGGVGTDVKACLEVPAEVKELWRNKVLESNGKKVNRSSSSKGAKRKKQESSQTSSSQSESEEDTYYMLEDSATKHVNPDGNGCSQRGDSNDIRADSIPMNPKRCIGRFFYETGLDFTAANSPSFKRMISSVAGPGVKYKIPSCEELKGCIFQDEVEEMQGYVRKIRESWATTGCSILLDTWTDEKGRNLVNFLVNCPQVPVYLCTHDVSSSIGCVDEICALLEGIIKDVGADNVVQIVADSTTGWVGALGKKFNKRKGVFWAVSASHCIELMLEKIGMPTSTKEILDKAKIITKFIHGHEDVLKLLKKHTNGRGLIKPSKIRAAIPFMTLDSIVNEKQELKGMFASAEWTMSTWASKVENNMVADIVEDQSFWTGAEMVSKATMPLVRALQLIFEAEKPLVGHIYETMDQVKERIKEELKNKKSQYMPIWEVIDDIWDNILHIPLHGAGYYLNPSLKYASDFYCDDEVYLGLMCCIAQMVDPSIQDVIHTQLKEYVRVAGSFKEGSSTGRRNTPPAMWWSSYGKQCPELQRFAIRILSQNSDGASRYGLKRTLAEKLVTNGRNPIEQQQLSDLTFLHYNLQLQKFCSGVETGIVDAEDIDPIYDWSIDETPETVAKNGNLKVEPAANEAVSEGVPKLQLKTEFM